MYNENNYVVSELISSYAWDYNIKLYMSDKYSRDIH